MFYINGYVLIATIKRKRFILRFMLTRGFVVAVLSFLLFSNDEDVLAYLRTCYGFFGYWMSSFIAKKINSPLCYDYFPTKVS